MDVTYFTGCDNGYDHSGGRGSRGNSMNDSNYSNTFATEELVSPSTLSPVLHCRHDSMASHFSVGQHQAEPQPCAAATQMTPHANNLHPYRSYAMSRGPSQISNHSSVSSSQHHGYQPYAPHNSQHSNFTTNRVPMLRSASDTPAVHTQPFNSSYSGSLPSHQSTRFSASPLVETSPTDVSTIPQYVPPIETIDNAVTDWDWSSLAGLTTPGEGIGGFDETAIAQTHESSFALALPVYPRPRAISFGHPPLSTSFTFSSTPIAKPNASDAQPVSPSTDSRGASPLPRKRRRHHTSASDSEPEIVTGHVLASGKFKCSDPECNDLKFGRQADFRRHYINVHAMKKDEFFCTYKGCDRSKRPSKKGKGRSFGSRRDKMEEHVRTVHEKADKRKMHNRSTEDEDEDEYEDVDTGDVDQPQRKTQRK